MGSTPSQVFDEECGRYVCRECKASTDVHSDAEDFHAPHCSHASRPHDRRIEELEEKVGELDARLRELECRLGLRGRP